MYPYNGYYSSDYHGQRPAAQQTSGGNTVPMSKQVDPKRPGYFFIKPQMSVGNQVQSMSLDTTTNGEQHGTDNKRKVDTIQSSQLEKNHQPHIFFQQQMRVQTHQNSNTTFSQQKQAKIGHGPGSHGRSNVRPSDSQESVNTLTEVCLSAPLADDEAQLLASCSTSNRKSSEQMSSAISSSKAVMMQNPTLQTHKQSHPLSQVASQPANRQLHTSQPISSSQTFSEKSSKTDTVDIDAILEAYRIKCHRECQKSFQEMKTKLLQINQEKFQMNGE